MRTYFTLFLILPIAGTTCLFFLLLLDAAIYLGPMIYERVVSAPDLTYLCHAPSIIIF